MEGVKIKSCYRPSLIRIPCVCVCVCMCVCVCGGGGGWWR